jgi:hypothetical protein
VKSKRPHMMDVACRYVRGMQCSAARIACMQVPLA